MSLTLGINIRTGSKGRGSGDTTRLMPMETGNTGIANTTFTTADQYTIHTVRGSSSGMVLTATGVTWSTFSGEVALASNYTLRASIEYPVGSGTWTTVTWGGNSNPTIVAGTMVDSDPVSRTWADGEQFGLWVQATGTAIPARVLSGNINTELYTDEGCYVASDASTTPRNNVPDNFTRRRRMCVIAGIFGQKSLTETTVAVVGDSMQSYGFANIEANAATSDRVRGDMVRTISQDYACINLGLGGNQWSSFVYGTLTNYRILGRRASVIVDAMGVNESNNRSGFSGALMLAYLQRALPLWTGRRYLKTNITPRSTGTYTTEAGQTAVGVPAINDFNTLIAAGVTTNAGVIDRRTPIQSSSPVNVFQANFTNDGLHLLLAGVSAIMATRTTIKAAIDAATNLIAPTQPSVNLTITSPSFSGGFINGGSVSGSALLPSTFGSTIEWRAKGTGMSMSLGIFGSIFLNGSGNIVHVAGNGSGTQVTGTAVVNDNVERHFRITAATNGVRRVYVDGVLDITSGTSSLVQIADTFAFTPTSVRQYRQLAGYNSVLNTSNFTPPSPGYITDPATTPNLVAYWPLATDGTGSLGPVLPQ